MLDFAAWVDIEFEEEPETTSVSLLKEPQAAFDAQVDAYLAEHRQEVVFSRLMCPACGSEYSRKSGHVTCPTERIPFERTFEGIPTKEVEIAPGKVAIVFADPDFDYKSIDLPPHEKCNTHLLEIFDINESEHVLSERAGFALRRQHDIVSRRHVVCAWLIEEGSLSRYERDGDVQSSLGDVRKHVTSMMEREVDRLTHRLAQAGDPLFLSGRRHLWPAGGTLQARHSDYLSVRDKMISSYNRLLGWTKDHPEFAELDEKYPEPREGSFPIPLPIERLRPPDDGASDTPNMHATIVQLTKQVEELKRAPVVLPTPDAMPAAARDAEEAIRRLGGVEYATVRQLAWVTGRTSEAVRSRIFRAIKKDGTLKLYHVQKLPGRKPNMAKQSFRIKPFWEHLQPDSERSQEK